MIAKSNVVIPVADVREGWRKVPDFAVTLLLLLLAMMPIGASTAVAQAQNPPPQPPPPAQQQQHPEQGSNWRVECTNDGKALDCRAVFQVTQRETNQLIAAVALRIPPDTKKPVILIQLPLGIQVTEPVTVQVDQAAPEKFGVQTCTQQGCFVGAPLSDALLAGMRTGKELKVAFANLNKQAVTVSMGLVGFGLAYDKIK
jgi:invasion protein IalB